MLRFPVWTLAAFLALGTPAFAQGFAVQPLLLDATPRAGQTVELPIYLTNTSVQGDLTVELELVELSQTPAGAWLPIAHDPASGPAHRASAFDWITLADEELSVPAIGGASTALTIRVPPGVRGAYFAALLAETPRPAEINGVVVRVRYLIPIIVHIQGRPVRQDVRMDDIGLALEGDETRPQGRVTRGYLTIANAGQTYSRIRGQLLVESRSGDRWRPVTRVEIEEFGILPAHELNLGADLPRRLPEGEYRLRGDLWVDGRRVTPIEKEIEFAGDPLAEALAVDTALLLQPGTIELEVAPGATRSATVTVENPGAEPVTVEMSVAIPEGLAGVTLGDIRGTDFSASGWTEIRPARFTIRPGGNRNLRVVARLPDEGVERASYYADVILKGTYPDGQPAGDTLARLTLTNVGKEGQPAAAVDDVLLSQADTASHYVVQTRLLNAGDVDFNPVADFRLIGEDGEKLRSEVPAEPDSLLPLGTRRLSQVMDFSEVPAGTYVLRAAVGYGIGLSATSQIGVGVEVLADGTRDVTVLDEGGGTVTDDALPAAD